MPVNLLRYFNKWKINLNKQKTQVIFHKTEKTGTSRDSYKNLDQNGNLFITKKSENTKIFFSKNNEINKIMKIFFRKKIYGFFEIFMMMRKRFLCSDDVRI